MMLTYTRVYSDLWSSQVANQGDVARCLAMFLITAPGANPFGLYYKPIELMAREFQRDAAVIRAALNELSSIDYCRYDEASGWVWVTKMAEHQFKPLPLKPNNLAIRGARRWYAHLNRNPFMGAWWDAYHVQFRLDDPGAFPGSQIERREWVGRELPPPAPPAPSAPATLPGLQPTTAIERRTTAVERRKSLTADEQAFESWWAHYPRKEAKAAALAKWKTKKIPAGNVPMMIEKLKAQARTEKWREGFIPHASTYLNQERWNDELQPAHVSVGGAMQANQRNRRTVDALADLSREISPFDLED